MTNLYKSVPVRSSEITPKHVYLSRRDFMKAATVAASAALLAACAPSVTEDASERRTSPNVHRDRRIG